MKIYGDNGIKITLPSGGGIEDVTVGGVSVVDDNVAVIPEIPTKTSDLTNDTGFITSSALPTKVSELQNDSGFITQTAIANYVENTDFATTDVGGVVKASDSSKFYVNASGAPIADVIQHQNWASTSDYAFVGKGTLNNVLAAKAYITENDIPSNVSYFTNDAGYITASDIPDPSVDDVQINGTSIVDSDGNADIPVADGNSYGVIKGLSGAGYVADNGELYASTLTAANYETAQNYSFVSKGTLENVLTSKGYALSSDIPTKVSDLNNDSGFITSSSLPTKVSDLTNDVGFITASDIPSIPTKTSDLTNDVGFITASDIPDPDVSDVQLNGTSIVDENGVANIKTFAGQFGINSSGQIKLEKAYNSYITARQPLDVSIGTSTFDFAVKTAMCDGVGAAWTEEEQAAARTRLGVDYPVKDVTVLGTSVVDENGVANIPKAGYSTVGVIKASEQYKFFVDYVGVPSADVVQYSNWSSTDNYAFVSKGTLNNVLAGRAYITENDTPSATFYGLAKAAGVEETGTTVGSYSAASLEAIQDMLGISGGNSDPTVYSPSGLANDAANIQTILNTYKSCKLTPGTYLLESEITMYDDYCLMGSGPSTILTFATSSGSGQRALLKFSYASFDSVADDRGGITVKDLTLRGAETISDSYITTSSSVGQDHGIRTISPDTSIGVYRSPNKVQNVIFEKFTGYCFKQDAYAYTNVDYTFGTTGRYTTNRIDFNGCTFRSSHGGYYDTGHDYTSGISFVDCLFNFLFLGIKIGGMGVDGVNTKFTEIYGQILLCNTSEYYPYLENSFTGCYFDGTHCSESADIRINPYGDPNFRTIFTSCIFIANKGYIYNGTVSCCNCRFVNSKQTYSGYVEMELEGLDAITSFICCSSDAIFDTWGDAYSNGKCKFVGCYKDDGTEIK